MEETTRLKLPFPDDEDAPDGPAQIGGLAEDIDGKILVSASCRVMRDSNQTINNETFTAVEFPEEDWDSDGFHSTISNKNRLVAPFDGLYIVTGCIVFAGSSVGLRSLQIVRNTTAPSKDASYAETSDKGQEPPGEGAGGNALAIHGHVPLKAGEYANLIVWQNSGGALNVMGGDAVHRSQATISWIGRYPL
jgi:hypothetical protein